MREAIADITARVGDVRYGPITKEGDSIMFTFDGVQHGGVLRGRNAQFVLSGNIEADRKLAVRVILDGHSTVTSRL